MTSAVVLSDALYLLADKETQALRESALLSQAGRNYGLLKSNLKKKAEVQKTIDAKELNLSLYFPHEGMRNLCH